MTPASAGNYSITVIATDKHLSFSRTSFMLRVTEPVAIGNLEDEVTFTVYPNPSQSLITIEPTSVLDNTWSIQLVNMLGEILYTRNEVAERSISVDISGIPESVMFIILTTDGRREYHKVIRN